MFIEPLVIILILVANGASLGFLCAAEFPCTQPLCQCLSVSHVKHAGPAATVGVVTETNAEKAIEELKAYEVREHSPKGCYMCALVQRQ